MIGFLSLVSRSDWFNRPPTLIRPYSSKTGLKERSVLLRGKGRSCSIQESSSPKTLLCTTLITNRSAAERAATVLYSEHLCHPLQMFSLLCRKDVQMCLRKAMVSIRSPHSENLSKRCDPKEPSKPISIFSTRTGLISLSSSGSIRGKDSSTGNFWTPSRWGGPCNQWCSCILTTGTVLVAESAGFLSEAIYDHCSGLVDFLIRWTLLATYTLKRFEALWIYTRTTLLSV